MSGYSKDYYRTHKEQSRKCTSNWRYNHWDSPSVRKQQEQAQRYENRLNQKYAGDLRELAQIFKV